MDNAANTPGPGYEVTLVRSFKAPAALLFDCFTQADHLAKWWGPLGCENTIRKLEPRPGGEISLVMKGPGYDHLMGGEFVEIDRPRRLVFLTKAFEAPDGGWGIVNRNTLTFEEMDGLTRLTLHTLVEKAAGEMVLGALQGMKAGWGQSLERLGDLTGGGGKIDIEVADRSVAFARAFDAPPERVGQALADLGHSSIPGQSADRLTGEWGRTTLTRTVGFADEAARDAALKAGLERDVAEGFDRLAAALAA